MVEAETKLARLAEWVRKNMDREGGFLKSDLYSFARRNDIERSALDFIYRCRKRGTMRDVNSKRIEVLIPKSRKLEEFYKDLLKIQDEPVLQGRPKPPLRKKKVEPDPKAAEVEVEKEPVMFRPPRRKIIRPETQESGVETGQRPSVTENSQNNIVSETNPETRNVSTPKTPAPAEKSQPIAPNARNNERPQVNRSVAAGITGGKTASEEKRENLAGVDDGKEIPAENSGPVNETSSLTALNVEQDIPEENWEPEPDRSGINNDLIRESFVDAIERRLEDRFKRIDDNVASINSFVEDRIDDLEKKVSIVIVRELEKRIQELQNRLEQYRDKAEAFDEIKRDAWEILQAFDIVEKEREDVKKVLKKFLAPKSDW